LSERVLITGGGGFIGSHLADQLIDDGFEVRVLDALLQQVHDGSARPSYLHKDVELVRADVRDPSFVLKALEDVDSVVHLAAAVGVGQSMYEIRQYVDINGVGTAVLLEALSHRPVERLVVASSMSIYGEGLYETSDGRPVPNAQRDPARIAEGAWDPVGEDGKVLWPVPTPEWKTPDLASVYALTKYDQERLCLVFGRAYGLPVTALRFFNTFGPRQALGNPYTGVLAIFASRILNGRAPLIYEDGHQQRDFVSVHDAARAIRLALKTDAAAGLALNVGSGEPRTILQVAETTLEVLERKELGIEVTGRYRQGDVRHCFADLALARKTLGYEPRVAFRNGLEELAQWLAEQPAVDRTQDAQAELESRGLLR